MPELIICFVLLALMAFKAREFTRLGVRGLCAVAILVAFASAGRAAFTFIPSVQPASFAIIVCAAILGSGAGLYCGVLTAVLSSVIMGFGPWTAWQALLWGLMGFFAPRFARGGLLPLTAYGFTWGFLFGWGMNIWFPLAGFVPVTWAYYLASCAASAIMDLAHAAVNAVLLLTASRVIIKQGKSMLHLA